MKQIYKSIATFGISMYLTGVGVNIINHTNGVIISSNEIENPIYGDNLRYQWIDHKKHHLDQLVNPLLLVPFSSTNHSHRPISIKVKYEEIKDRGIELKVDIEGQSV